MTLKIPCLSTYQPWAELLAAGIKPIENRGRISNYRGPLLIHAAKKFDANWSSGLYGNALEKANNHLESVCHFPTQLPKGCIVGFVIQTDCYSAATEDVLYSDYEWYQGQYGLKMRYPVKFTKPIPYIGRQGLFRADVSGCICPVDAIKIVSSIKKWGKDSK